LADHLRHAVQRIGAILQRQLQHGFEMQRHDQTLVSSLGEARNKTVIADIPATATKIVDEFLLCRLSKVKVLLRLDVEAMFVHDVAAQSVSEVVLCYPSVLCMLHQRIAHELHLLGAPPSVTRMLTEMAHSKTGIDIHPETTIGHHFFVDHGTGVVIGATAIIGNHVKMYQGVTLGARSFPVDPKTGLKIKSLPRHPIIEDNVTLYSNAVVLGRIRIGQGSTIAGNVWVTQDVPPGTTVVQTKSQVRKGVGQDIFFAAGDGI
jgi:serine O-acetyltransferase